MVEAAGGVVVRLTSQDDVEVLVIHRPHRDDWSLPKGKRRRRESIEHCALREVLEETGLVCDLGVELSSTSYLDRLGRPKIVRYWAMRATSGVFTPNREVDEVRWMPVDRVGDLLTHERDITVVADCRAMGIDEGRSDQQAISSEAVPTFS